MRNVLLGFAAILCVVGLSAHSQVGGREPQAARQPKTAGPVGKFMQAKLEHSQKVLEGLALRDFPRIATNARELAALSQAAEWHVFDTEDYVRQSQEFRRTALTLEKTAQERNLDGVALAYLDLTMKCVACHKYVRGVRMAGLDSGDTERAVLAMEIFLR